MDIIETIERHAIRYPDKSAHIWRDQILTYEQLSQRSNRLANHIIRTFGIDRTPIIVYGHKQNDMLVCFLACVKAGHAYIPVNSYLPADRIHAIIRSAGAKLVLCAEEPISSFEGIESLGGERLADILAMGHSTAPEDYYRVREDDVFYIIYTSGSTGKPKGVQITLHNLHSFLGWARELGSVPEREDHVFLNVAPFSFDLSVMDLYLSLATGGTLFSVDHAMIDDPQELFSYLNKSNATVCVCTPSFADMCLADESFGAKLMPYVSCFLFCGETLTNKTADELIVRFPGAKVINLYGPTEATVAVTAVEVTREICDHISPLPVGVVKGDCEILILDEQGQSVPEGEHGEIVIVGESVSTGYYANPGILAGDPGGPAKEPFFRLNGRQAYRTGDEGYLRGNMLYYCGRMDFQIKLHGFRIEIEDIENNIRRLAGVANATVVPCMAEGKVSHLAAFVIPRDPNAPRGLKAIVALKQELKAFLPDYMIPRKILFRDQFPTNANGKIDRKALALEVK